MLSISDALVHSLGESERSCESLLTSPDSSPALCCPFLILSTGVISSRKVPRGGGGEVERSVSAWDAPPLLPLAVRGDFLVGVLGGEPSRAALLLAEDWKSRDLGGARFAEEFGMRSFDAHVRHLCYDAIDAGFLLIRGRQSIRPCI